MNKLDRVLRNWKIIWTTLAVVASLAAVYGIFKSFFTNLTNIVFLMNLNTVSFYGSNVAFQLAFAFLASVLVSGFVVIVIWWVRDSLVGDNDD